MKGETTMVVTDQEIANGVETLLRQSPANSFNSLNGVVQLLGARFGQDLSHKTAFIQEVLRYHHQLPPSPIPLQHHPQFLNINHQFPSHFAHLPAGFRSPFSPPSPGVQVAPQLQHPPQGPPPPKNAGKGNKESVQAGTKRRGGAGGLNKVCGVSPELQVVVGEPALPRTEIVKQLWAYIRKNNLQDPSNKRKIICDDALRAVFEIDCTDMFKMNKLLSKHIHSLDSSKTESEPALSKRLKTDDAENSSENPESVDCSVTISEPLAMFLGTGKKEMLQSEAIQYVLEYIKVNQLEDPNAMTVMCDLKLRELFGCESINISDVHNMLARHHLFKT